MFIHDNLLLAEKQAFVFYPKTLCRKVSKNGNVAKILLIHAPHRKDKCLGIARSN